LLAASLLLPACPGPLELAEKARADEDFTLAAEMYRRASIDMACPQRAATLLKAAEVQELSGKGASALESIDMAIEQCPDHAEAYWARAQRAMEAGDRARALEDTKHVQSLIPEAAALYSELAAEVEMERSVRDQSRALVDSVRTALTLEAPEAKVPDDSTPATLARQIPIPVTLRYRVVQDVDKPRAFRMGWEEMWSYRGDAAEGAYVLVRTLDLPPVDRELPLHYRLLMSNQRLPMRFNVSAKGEVLDASWLNNGPDRGMRPEMLRPEVEGMLKRRRLFDPGEKGQRAPGETWRGEDTRIVDGRATALEYASRAEGWAEVAGLRVLHIASTLTGKGYTAREEQWIHPETAIAVRWTRQASYQISSESGPDPWSERFSASLVSVSGGDADSASPPSDKTPPPTASESP
jgi:hypothetical protein